MCIVSPCFEGYHSTNAEQAQGNHRSISPWDNSSHFSLLSLSNLVNHSLNSALIADYVLKAGSNLWVVFLYPLTKIWTRAKYTWRMLFTLQEPTLNNRTLKLNRFRAFLVSSLSAELLEVFLLQTSYLLLFFLWNVIIMWKQPACWSAEASSPNWVYILPLKGQFYLWSALCQ